MVWALMFFYVIQTVGQLVNREEPDRAFYKLTNSRSKEEQLNLPSIGDQMYIGLSQKTDYKDGTSITSFIDIDPAYLNVKIDYYDKRKLVARKNLAKCDPSERSDFDRKVENTNGIAPQDFPYMLCIEREQFNLFNVAGSTERNSITLHFEQCGGKYAKSKEFPEVIKA